MLKINVTFSSGCDGGYLDPAQSSAIQHPGAPRSRSDLNVVDDLGDTGRRPGGPLGQTALEPGMDLAAENHFSALRPDGDPRGVQFGAAAQSLLDFLLDLIHLHS